MVNKYASRLLPFDKLSNVPLIEALRKYYEEGILPNDPLILAILERRDVNGLENKTCTHPADIHRWIQEWFPARAWGSHRKVKKWCENFKGE